MITLRSLLCPAAVLLGAALPALAQQTTQLRPPATPLVTHDPYFSLWSNTDKLTDSPTRHWTGHPEPLTGLIRVDGSPYRLIGPDPRDVPAATQTALTVAPTHTRYSFQAGPVVVDLTFFTPAFLDDLDILSRPVSYVTWSAHSADSAQHKVEVFLSANADLATSYENQPVNVFRHRTATSEVLSVGTRSQDVLNRSGDNLRIDWGYFHLIVPDNEDAQTTISVDPAQQFAKTGTLFRGDDMDPEQTEMHPTPELAAMLSLGSVGASPVSRHVLVAYTDDYAIQYLHRNLRDWWQRNGKPVATMLDEAEQDYTRLDKRGNDFDAELTADMTAVGGEHYAWICTLSYRQSIAAHKLVADVEGKPMFFGKENFSNGSIDTVDVLYPAAPLYLLMNPGLLEAEIRPLLEYVALPNRWKFPFAPHDLGQYPLADGQTYGGGEKTEENQMPVEESGNLLILIDALAQLDTKTGPDAHGLDLARQYWPILTQWANYLKEHGLDPERQLTTDDFAGHVVHNANLSLKAIDALAAYADLAKRLDHPAEAKAYAATAKDYAGKWVTMDKEGDHYKLAYNSPGTWSQKYNLVWDKVLGYNLFPASVRESEIRFYKTRLNVYGLPLDSRKDYTKLDWELWTATLADNRADFDTFVDPIYKWTNEGPTRVPLTDWYDTKTGKQEGFQARSVVGGVFIKALTDRKLADKWRNHVVTQK